MGAIYKIVGMSSAAPTSISYSWHKTGIILFGKYTCWLWANGPTKRRQCPQIL